MHELGIVFHALDRVQKLAEENELTKIASVTMEFGEVSGVVTQEMVRCWNWAVKKRPPVLQEAELKIEEIPAVTFCEDCRQEYPTLQYGKICPYCKSPNTYLVQGNEINIKELEAY
ncbi:MAG: hydrogenase maturation nickel metallochaperone HypA [Firmicutes bacterium]|nr:hydrogenase maturation nickel metallochaperone HypA [Bacillota bacterium]MBQ4409300.1 hydrogenase maturation nickel metallochaperone HypA [Bacillota bacterium]MBR0517535.1 hydrogenase maturation nickel metallochaperone HypA [Bacillota bacterium]MBR3034023.1 hydrogenase maturation nickel metallochaperone HypA [Bacillota bacterium]MBR4143713.1 hydrogenase maturation nickel metallochaperone HypA [Bacillota bacterium]